MSLKIMDTLIGTIDDRRLVIAGVSKANGEGGLYISDCDFGYFAPETNSIVYKGVIDVKVDVEIQLE